MPDLKFSTHACSISDEWTYKGMDVIWLENDLVRIGVLAGRGSDIFEFHYKPASVDFMLRLPPGIRNPQRDFSQMRDTSNQFEDYYYGGWQEILPNSPTFVYRGASLGQHGEVSLTPWQHALIETGPDRVSARLWARPLRVPVLIEKTLTLDADTATLRIDERLTNEGRTHLDLMWGHHIAFGLPFLRDGALIQTNAQRFVADASIPAPRRFKPDVETAWPAAPGIDGIEDDASAVPPEDAPPYNDLAYLSGYDAQAWYAIKSARHGVGFRVAWDGRLFKHVWYWQERYASPDAPWWGRAYAVALEPWTTRYSPDAEASIQRGEWLHLNAGQTITTQLSAAAFEDV
ncbi:MAG: aldose 1-epimerase [Chloroflexi bacterium]|nr:aldose 1-epimerase [Chloroflexota bacterium]